MPVAPRRRRDATAAGWLRNSECGVRERWFVGSIENHANARGSVRLTALACRSEFAPIAGEGVPSWRCVAVCEAFIEPRSLNPWKPGLALL